MAAAILQSSSKTLGQMILDTIPFATKTQTISSSVNRLTNTLLSSISDIKAVRITSTDPIDAINDATYQILSGLNILNKSVLSNTTLVKANKDLIVKTFSETTRLTTRIEAHSKLQDVQIRDINKKIQSLENRIDDLASDDNPFGFPGSSDGSQGIKATTVKATNRKRILTKMQKAGVAPVAQKTSPEGPSEPTGSAQHDPEKSATSGGFSAWNALLSRTAGIRVLAMVANPATLGVAAVGAGALTALSAGAALKNASRGAVMWNNQPSDSNDSQRYNRQDASEAPVGFGGTNSSGTNSSGTNSSSGGGSAFLKDQRQKYIDELQANPSLQRKLTSLITHESPNAMESLFNRMALADSLGKGTTLEKYLNRTGLNQFYGPIRDNKLRSLSEKEFQQNWDRLIVPAFTSNKLKGATDQGSGNDPNVEHTGGLIKVPGDNETYNDFGGFGHEKAANFRKQQQAAYEKAEQRSREAGNSGSGAGDKLSFDTNKVYSKDEMAKLKANGTTIVGIHGDSPELKDFMANANQLGLKVHTYQDGNGSDYGGRFSKDKENAIANAKRMGLSLEDYQKSGWIADHRDKLKQQNSAGAYSTEWDNINQQKDIVSFLTDHSKFVADNGIKTKLTLKNMSVDQAKQITEAVKSGKLDASLFDGHISEEGMTDKPEVAKLLQSVGISSGNTLNTDYYSTRDKNTGVDSPISFSKQEQQAQQNNQQPGSVELKNPNKAKIDNVDPRLKFVSSEATRMFERDNPGYSIQLLGPGSGVRYSGSTRNHGIQRNGYGGAMDFGIISPDGRQLADRGNVRGSAEAAPLYVQFHHNAKIAQSKFFPDMPLGTGFGFPVPGTMSTDMQHLDVTHKDFDWSKQIRESGMTFSGLSQKDIEERISKEYSDKNVSDIKAPVIPIKERGIASFAGSQKDQPEMVQQTVKENVAEGGSINTRERGVTTKENVAENGAIVTREKPVMVEKEPEVKMVTQTVKENVAENGAIVTREKQIQVADKSQATKSTKAVKDDNQREAANKSKSSSNPHNESSTPSSMGHGTGQSSKDGPAFCNV